jgi:hypothetical protein
VDCGTVILMLVIDQASVRVVTVADMDGPPPSRTSHGFGLSSVELAASAAGTAPASSSSVAGWSELWSEDHAARGS